MFLPDWKPKSYTTSKFKRQICTIEHTGCGNDLLGKYCSIHGYGPPKTGDCLTYIKRAVLTLPLLPTPPSAMHHLHIGACVSQWTQLIPSPQYYIPAIYIAIWKQTGVWNVGWCVQYHVSCELHVIQRFSYSDNTKQTEQPLNKCLYNASWSLAMQRQSWVCPCIYK